MTCIRCNHGTAKRFGYSGKRHIQRWRCTSCKTTFSESAPKLGTHYTDPETAAKALSMMLEGMSIYTHPCLLSSSTGPNVPLR
jgi:transposase-like protein